jgi:hypothetical protein
MIPPAARAITFTGEMVSAVRSGAKTETRRIIKPAPDLVLRCEGQPPTLRRGGRAVDCPFGNAGDLLWVREPWSRIDHHYIYHGEPSAKRLFMASSMPRAACRLLLRVEAIAVEQLREIAPAGVRREGAPQMDDTETVAWFVSRWDALAPSGAQWKDNPWVWVVRFSIAAGNASRSRL